MPKTSLKSSLPVDADDSSDEEEVSEKAEQYDIKKSYREFMDSDDVPKYIRNADPEGYSFIAFALGIQKLYSPEVNHIYYEKKRALPSSKIDNTDEEVEQWIKNALFRTIRRVFLLKTQSTITRALAEQFIELLKTENELDEILEEWCQNHRIIFKQLQSEEILPEFSSLLEKIVNKVTQWIENLKIEKKKLSAPPCLRYQDYSAFSDAARQEIINYLKNKNIVDKNGKFSSAADRPTVTEKNKLKKMILTEVSKYDGRKSVRSIPDKFVKSFFKAQLREEVEKEDGILEEIDDDLYLKENLTEQELADSEISHYFVDDEGDVVPDIFAYYSHYTVKRLKQELLADVEEYFAQNFLEALHETKRELDIKLKRGLLEQQHRFVSNDPMEFLSNLRLNIRVQKRRVRQEQDELGKKALRTEAFHMAWQFGQQPYLALESQEITTKGGRSDLVVNLTSYKGIALELAELKKSANKNLDFKINNRLIADWIHDFLEKGAPNAKLVRKKDKAVLKFEELSEKDKYAFNKFLINFTYLLLGCEIQRQPSGICIHLLMLNLIQKSELTWDQAISSEDKEKVFGGGVMPMSMGSYKNEADKKAVAHPVLCARILQRRYSIFAVRTYSYPGESAKESGEQKKQIVELITRENSLIKRWLENAELIEEKIEDQIDSISKHIDSVYKPKQ